MSKSVELLAGSEDVEPISDQTRAEKRSGLNLNGSRQISKSATELRENNDANAKSSIDRHRPVDHPSVVHRHHRHTSVAQRTHTFFATLKSRWSRSRSKERKKSRDSFGIVNQDSFGNQAVESDYAGDYSSEHSKSSSATQSPARHCLNHPESPLARGSKEKAVALQEDSPGKSKGSLGFQGQRDGNSEDQPKVQRRYSRNDPTTALLQDEASRRRELALRQHAFFQLRLHIRRGANLVAMDRCGASDPYVKIKSSGRLLHKSRTVHRDLNPVWDESVTLPIEDAFQPLTIKVFDYDWGLQDDFMGAAQLDLTQLELGHPQDIVLELKDPARPRQHLGEIFLTATLWPRFHPIESSVSTFTDSMIRKMPKKDYFRSPHYQLSKYVLKRTTSLNHINNYTVFVTRFIFLMQVVKNCCKFEKVRTSCSPVVLSFVQHRRVVQCLQAMTSIQRPLSPLY